MEKNASCGGVLNQFDREKMRLGITCMSYSEEIEPIQLIKDMYSVAFSKEPDIDGTPSEVLDKIFLQSEDGVNYRRMVIPTLYGGCDCSVQELESIMGKSAPITESALIEGDVILSHSEAKTELYIYGGRELISLADGYKRVDTEKTLKEVSSSSLYAAIRPSLSMNTLHHYEMIDKPDAELTEEQNALIATAEAYFNRGYRVQYDDTRISAKGGEFRWQIGKYNPEDYTSQRWGYINCAAFTYELYRTAIGYDLGNLFTTERLAGYYANGGAEGALFYPYQYVPNLNATADERASVQSAFLSKLEIGDLVVVRRKDTSGHVMMYVGNNTVVHSGGNNFLYDKDCETYEPTVKYMNLIGYFFEPTARNYVFREDGYVTRLCIVRPLDEFKGEIPKNTLNRMANLKDILSEKISTSPDGKTVNVGDEVTFTFKIKNIGSADKTVKVEETLPTNAVLKSADGAVIADNKLIFTLKVSAGESRDVSYTVIANGENGSSIESAESLVGGVMHTCHAIRIAKTLKEETQTAIKSAVIKFKGNNPDGLIGTELVNAIYEEAGVKTPFVDKKGKVISESSLRNSVMNTEAKNDEIIWKINEESEFSDMLVDGLYGGRRVFTPLRYMEFEKINTNRSRLPRKQSFVVGDIIFAKFSNGERMYMYVGEGTLVNLSTREVSDDSYAVSVRLMRLMCAHHYYFVLRPSMG